MTETPERLNPSKNATLLLPARQVLSFPARIGNYIVEGTLLGKGNFAMVRLATHIPTGEKVAMKIIDKNKLSTDNLQKVYREIAVMKLLNHPHVVRLYQTLECLDYVFLATEYAPGGEIFNYLSANGRFKEQEARILFQQILTAVGYCHAHDVVHRDLKAENLLLDAQMNIKLADFGFSNVAPRGQLLSEWCGSPPYAAPELFLGQPYDGVKCDIWSLGIVLYVMVCGALPFDEENVYRLRNRILSGKFRVPYYMSQECEQLLRQMLIVDPAKRCTLEEVAEHPWMASSDGDLFKNPLLMQNSMYEDCGFEDSEPNEFVLDEMEALGCHRNIVRHMLLVDNFQNISATYHLLNDRFVRKLKNGTCTLSTPMPIKRETVRRSSIITGTVERDSSAESDSYSDNYKSGHRKLDERGCLSLGSPRRASLPQHLPPTAPARNNKEKPHRTLGLVPENRKHIPSPSLLHVKNPLDRRASEGTACASISSFNACSSSSNMDNHNSSSSLQQYICELSLSQSNDEPDSEEVQHYLGSSRGHFKRHTLGECLSKRSQLVPTSERRYSPVRRHSDSQTVLNHNRANLEHLYAQAVLPIEEMQRLQNQLDSGHVSPFCHSPMQDVPQVRWSSQQLHSLKSISSQRSSDDDTSTTAASSNWYPEIHVISAPGTQLYDGGRFQNFANMDLQLLLPKAHLHLRIPRSTRQK